MAADSSTYAGREQAEVKHYFLRQYLDSLIHKTASKYDHIAYVDGYSGPWQSSGEDFSDTSFGIALAALRQAKVSWKRIGRDVTMSAHLVEQSAASYKQLDAIKPKFPDIDIYTYHGDFVQLAPTINAAIPKAAFAFLFIDPKGWRIELQRLAPLLARPNAEVLFNFMFDFINRAASIDDPVVAEGLDKLIPHGDWRQKLQALPTGTNVSKARKDILVDAFRTTLATVGNYSFVAEVPVLRPLKDRLLYSLVYATRHSAGIQVFRGCHVKTERKQDSVWTAAKRAHEEAKTGQGLLFDTSVQMGPQEIEAFLAAEKTAAQAMLLNLVPQAPRTVAYDDVWPRVLERHVVTRPDVNQMAAGLRKIGELVFPNWEAGKRVPADSYRMYRSGNGTP